MSHKNSGISTFLGIFTLYMFLKLLFLFGGAVSTSLVDTNPPTGNVVAVAATGRYSTVLHFYCQVENKYYECSKEGTSEELFFEKGEKLVSAVGIGPFNDVTFYCESEGEIHVCVPKILVEVDQ